MSKNSGKDEKKISAYKSDEKGNLDGASIAFGIINLLLVGMCFLIKLTIISAGLVLFFMLGFYASFLEVKDGIVERELKGFLQGMGGLTINIIAVVLYLLILKSRFS